MFNRLQFSFRNFQNVHQKTNCVILELLNNFDQNWTCSSKGAAGTRHGKALRGQCMVGSSWKGERKEDCLLE